MSKLYFLVPAVYGVLIALFLMLQFSGRVTVHEQVGPASIRVSMPSRSAGTGTGISSISVRVGRADFTFRESEPIELILKDRRVLRERLSGYSVEPSSLLIKFGESASLEFLVSGGSNSMRLLARADLPDVESMMLSFPDLSAGRVDVNAGPIPLLSIPSSSAEGGRTLLFFPPFSRIGRDASTISLRASRGSFGEIVVGEYPQSDQRPYADWFALQYQFPEDADYEHVVDSYVQKSHSAWISSRLNRQSLTWTMPSGGSAFDESILAYVLAESVNTGAFDSVFGTALSASGRYRDQLSELTAPYLGDIVTRVEEAVAKDGEEIARMRELIRNDDLAIFGEYRLFPFVLDRAPYSIVQGLDEMAATTEKTSDDIRDTLGMVETYLDTRGLDPEISASFIRFLDLVELALLPAIVPTDRGLFVSANGTLDTRLSVEAGELLIRAGDTIANEIYRGIGKALVTASLTLADAAGSIPANLSLSDGIAQPGKTLLPSEAFYPLVTHSAYLPKEVTLDTGDGPGTWMWTAARDVRMERLANRVVLRFSFPVGRTHSFAVRGIEPFSSVEMFGIAWQSDSRFQSYSSGWIYDQDTKTLYVKVTHRSEDEQFVILY